MALECLKEVQHEAFLLGIPLRTRHREVAPNQYELAPLFGIAAAQVDQNLMVMQILEEPPVHIHIHIHIHIHR